MSAGLERRAEVDTTPPFESVKEAVSWFGSSAPWCMPPPPPFPSDGQSLQLHGNVDPSGLQNHTSSLENDVLIIERETLEVLEELEATKRVVDELQLKLNKKEYVPPDVHNYPSFNSSSSNQIIEQRSSGNNIDYLNVPASPPHYILMELKKAKLNLSKTNSEISDVRSSVEALKKNLEEEEKSFQKTRERLGGNRAQISSMEEELINTRIRLRLARVIHSIQSSENPETIRRELHKLTSETEHFRRMTEKAKYQVSKMMFDLELTKTSIHAAEIKWAAAKKMQEAAKATKAVAIAEMQALTTKNNDFITISCEEYALLVKGVREAEALSNKRIDRSMSESAEAELSKETIVRKVEEAAEEVKISTKALEEALIRVEAANRDKHVVEEALREWKREHGRKCQMVNNSLSYKRSCPSKHTKRYRQLDLNHTKENCDGHSKRVLNNTSSLGTILSTRLPDEELATKEQIKRSPGKMKASLGQILNHEERTLSPPLIEEKLKDLKLKEDGRKMSRIIRGIAHLFIQEDQKKKKTKEKTNNRNHVASP